MGDSLPSSAPSMITRPYGNTDRQTTVLGLGGAFIDAVSFEDAHRHNDLSLLERLGTTSVIFGVVAIARSEVESVDAIRERLQQALQHIDAERLIAAPDCGLGLLGRELAMAKLNNMCAAARSL